MAEEFHESDIVFGDSSFDCPEIFISAHRNPWGALCNNARNKTKDHVTDSLPVKIPETGFRYSSDSDELEYEWRSEEIVPPHVIVGRRLDRKMAFSVCTGHGRTLKGRDLSQVRNSILRMTGFLET